MAEDVKAPAEAEGDVAEDVSVDMAGVKTKEEVYDKLAAAAKGYARATQDGRIVMAKSKGRDLFVLALQGIFEILYNEGKVALPAGHGSIQLVGLGPRKQRTPQGVIIDVPARWVVRINPGVKVDERVSQLAPPKITEQVPADAESAPTPAA